jgi:hypothetical protein
MSLVMLDEVDESLLLAEIDRRRMYRERFLCDYCGRDPTATSPCKFAGRHTVKRDARVGAVGARSVLQDWVQTLGLRHQGVLVSAVRGCDTAAKGDVIKALVRCLRAEILNPHCGDAKKAVSYIEACEPNELERRMGAVLKSHDHYPYHYLMHLMHASAVLGYHHRDEGAAERWRTFYFAMVHKMHLFPETKSDLDRRLNADEAAFAAAQ